MTTEPQPEFPHIVRVESLKGAPRRLDLSADDAQRAALARRYGVLAVDSLVASLEVRPFRALGMSVRGTVTARLQQTCGITLEPMATEVVEAIDARFLPDSMIEPEAEEMLDPDAPDPPEPMAEGGVDVGELVAQHVALGIDPFPRRSDAVLNFTPDPEEKPPNPFSVLQFRK
ncbi:YceD family protein [Zavarzinia sp. CC-PAN008]|uniref:YceD family protein n=1 Tax=Zavarzinia sp. CC-PAN008 TaxID=3243332 RepID=UPI003F743F3C